MTLTQKAIIRTLLYFDIFSHPLDKIELYEHINEDPGKEEFEKDLEELLEKKIIRNESGYFCIGDKSSIPERKNNLERSKKYLRIARFVSGIIYRHPFVRGVMVSGSLSKCDISENDDIDFFVIAHPGRIWLCRAILMLFKKLFLLNSKKYFCINYFIDTLTLEIAEKNIFTATEIAFLIPQRNTVLSKQFLDANNWVISFFPNLKFRFDHCRDSGDPFIKRMLEIIFKGKSGDWLDNFFMEVYRKRALKKYGNTDPSIFYENFKSEKNRAKYHPGGFQHEIINQFKERVSAFEASEQITLSI